MTSQSSFTDPVLIQPVESPVICKPYYEPTQYWEYDRQTGRAALQPGRRPAAYWYKFADADTRHGQLALELEEDRRDLALVNKLRGDIKRCRNAGWEGATNVTKNLLRHWQRKDRPRRWVAAVNHWGRLGGWDFTVCRDPQRLPMLLARSKKNQPRV